MYGLLLLGPSKRRIWFVIDRDTLYVDLNSDADLRDPDEALRQRP